MSVITSEARVEPCYKDLCRYTIDHNNYPADKKVLINALDPEQYITRKDAENRIYKMICGLHARGMKRGDTICVVHPNHILYPVIFLGIVGAGGRYTGANPSYTPAELTHHFEISETKFVITDRARFSAVREAIMFMQTHPTIFLWDDDEGQHRSGFGFYSSIHDIFQGTFGELRNFNIFDDAKLSRNTVAALVSTSGTTGMPKMAARSHHSLVMENLAIEDTSYKPYEVKRLLFTPFFHGFTAPLALISAIRSGHTTYILPRFNAQTCLDVISRYNITEVAMPPPVLLKYLEYTPSAREALRSIRLVWSGGAPISAELQSEAAKMFHATARITQVYGMTEAGWITTFPYREPDFTGSVGRLLPTYEAKLLDAAGNIITTPNTSGDLFVRGPMVMQGYLNNVSATTKALDKEGWLDTGDVAAFNAGRIFVVDRKKDIIKVRGWQVSPSELEARLLAHASVVDAAVVGVVDVVSGERPVAFAVLNVGEEEDREGLKKWMREGLAGYKVDDLEVVFRGDLPKSISGKVLRRVLKEELGARE